MKSEKSVTENGVKMKGVTKDVMMIADAEMTRMTAMIEEEGMTETTRTAEMIAVEMMIAMMAVDEETMTATMIGGVAVAVTVTVTVVTIAMMM